MRQSGSEWKKEELAILSDEAGLVSTIKKKNILHFKLVEDDL